MTNWNAVWERKGRLETDDLVELDGFEHTAIDPAQAASGIVDLLEIGPNDRVLDVGCGAGMIAQYLACDYVGLDSSASLAGKLHQLLGRRVVRGEAGRLCFRAGAFDKAIAFSVFQYFPDSAYAGAALAELERVAKVAVFVGDLPVRSHRPDHLLYDPASFRGWKTTPGFYHPDRFNAVRRLR